MQYGRSWKLFTRIGVLLLTLPLCARAQGGKPTLDLKPVTQERLLKGTADTSAWLMYGGNYQGWYMGVNSSGNVIFSVSTLPASSPWLLSNTALPLNSWYHVTVTYDGSTGAGTIYINGAQDAQAVFPGFTAQSAPDLFLGRASWYDGYYLNALLDEVRLLGFRQAPPEVLADYQSFP